MDTKKFRIHFLGISIKKRYLLTILAIGGIFVLLQARAKVNQAPEETFTVKKGNITQTIAASGNVQPDGKVEVFSSTNGVITEYLVENDQYVEAGQPLFTVASTATPAEKAAAKAAFTTAVAARQKARQDKFTAQSGLESARQAILDAQVAVDSMEDNLNNSKVNPDTGDDYTTDEKESIYSELISARQSFEQAEKKFQDFDTDIQSKLESELAKRIAYEATNDQTVVAAVPGTVANLGPGVGEEVFIASKTGSEPVLTLTDFSEYTVEVEIKEADIYVIKTGQKASVILDAIDDTELQAKVKKIDSLGQVVDGLVTYDVTIDLIDNDTRLRPGMTANVWIETDSKQNTLLVPNDYLRLEAEGSMLAVETNSGRQMVIVTIGLKDEKYTEIIDGVSEGDTIVKILDE